MEGLHKIWPHRWVNPKAKANKSSLHGVGVFAKELIKKGEAVGVFGGIVVPTKEIQKYWKKIGHIGIQISDDFFIVPSTRKEVEKGGIFNHSCEPNCGFTNTFTLVAIKDINPGEELTFDYAFCEATIDDFECNCKYSGCRKVITKDDWKRKDIQKKYKKFFSPFLYSKIWNTNKK